MHVHFTYFTAHANWCIDQWKAERKDCKHGVRVLRGDWCIVVRVRRMTVHDLERLFITFYFEQRSSTSVHQ